MKLPEYAFWSVAHLLPAAKRYTTSVGEFWNRARIVNTSSAWMMMFRFTLISSKWRWRGWKAILVLSC